MRWRPTIYSTARPVLLMVLSAALLFAAPARSQNLDPSLSTDSSLLEINLHELGYDTSRGNPRLPQFVDFTDSNHIALAWLTFDDPSVARHMKFYEARPAQLHALIPNAKTGQRENYHEWATPSQPVHFAAENDGRLLTCTGATWRLFSPTFELWRSRELPGPDTCLNAFFASSSGIGIFR